jgi:hypothetical protein
LCYSHRTQGDGGNVSEDIHSDRMSTGKSNEVNLWSQIYTFACENNALVCYIINELWGCISETESFSDTSCIFQLSSNSMEWDEKVCVSLNKKYSMSC